MFDNALLKIIVQLEDLSAAGFGKLNANVGAVGGKFDEASKSGSKFGNVMQGVGMSLGMMGMNAVSSAIGDVTSFIEGSTAAADQLNKSIAKTTIVFGA